MFQGFPRCVLCDKDLVPPELIEELEELLRQEPHAEPISARVWTALIESHFASEECDIYGSKTIEELAKDKNVAIPSQTAAQLNDHIKKMIRENHEDAHKHAKQSKQIEERFALRAGTKERLRQQYYKNDDSELCRTYLQSENRLSTNLPAADMLNQAAIIDPMMCLPCGYDQYVPKQGGTTPEVSVIQ